MIPYDQFLEDKQHFGCLAGFEPVWMPDCLFDFQHTLVEWSIRKGRAAIFADCGLGKTLMELVAGENFVRKTNGRTLILTPLAVAHQFVSEGERFGIGVTHCRDGKVGGAGVYVTNYERLHLFDRNDFTCVICDESGILKNFDGKIKDGVIDFMRKTPYRLLGSATAAPNDFTELGNSSEALGELGYQDMLTRFFKKENQKSIHGWGRLKYKMRGYAKRDFWRWVCSWARACRKPSDLGFEDGRFVLPELVTEEHEVSVAKVAAGQLFDVAARTLREQQDETRRSIRERCEKAAELVTTTKGPSISWCHLNDEGDLLQRLIPDSVQVSGRDSDDEKEEKLLAFANGEITKLVSKPKVTGFGLNWQHCAHQTYFPSHSFEQWYQGVRRSWRFGQTRPVKIDVVTTEGGAGVLANLRRKQVQADEMFRELVALMNESLAITKSVRADSPLEVPSWLNQA